MVEDCVWGIAEITTPDKAVVSRGGLGEEKDAVSFGDLRKGWAWIGQDFWQNAEAWTTGASLETRARAWGEGAMDLGSGAECASAALPGKDNSVRTEGLKWEETGKALLPGPSGAPGLAGEALEEDSDFCGSGGLRGNGLGEGV